jgi:hypothetical protein
MAHVLVDRLHMNAGLPLNLACQLETNRYTYITKKTKIYTFKVVSLAIQAHCAK